MLLSSEKKDWFMALLFQLAKKYEVQLQAWAIMSNHYHFIGVVPSQPDSLGQFIRHLHSASAVRINREDNAPRRKVWYQYWDKLISFNRSYLARLNYVNNNPVHHRVIDNAENYHWCSAAWFKTNMDRAFTQTVASFKMDQLNVHDDF